jgi:hypothetical protein
LPPYIGGGPYHFGSTWFLHELDSQNFLWNINDREDRKVPGLSVWLPLALRLAYSDAALEGLIDAAQVSDEPALQGADLVSNPIVANVMALASGQRRGAG